jgi:carboxylesterase
VRFLSLRDGFHIIPRDTAGPLLASEVSGFLEQWRYSETWDARHVGA